MTYSKTEKPAGISKPALVPPCGEGSIKYDSTIYDTWDRWLRGLGHNGARTTEAIGVRIILEIQWLVDENFGGESVGKTLDQLQALVWCGHEGMTWHMSRIIACRIVENQLEKGLAFGKINQKHCDKCKGLFPGWYLGPSRSFALDVQEEKAVKPSE